MINVKYNDKENEIVKEESEEKRGLTFPLEDSSELSISFLSSFKSAGTNNKSSHQDLSCLFHFFLVSRAFAQITEAAT